MCTGKDQGGQEPETLEGVEEGVCREGGRGWKNIYGGLKHRVLLQCIFFQKYSSKMNCRRGAWPRP